MFDVTLLELTVAGSEIALAAFACLLLMLRPSKPLSVMLGLAGIGAALFMTTQSWLTSHSVFSETFFAGPLEAFLKGLLFVSGALALFLLHDDEKITSHHAESISLILMMLCGSSLLVSSRHLILTWLSFELISVPAYVLVAIRPSYAKGSEGGLKYAVFGGASSAVMLYGFSFVFGAVGSAFYSDIASAFASATPSSLSAPFIVAALVLIFVGVMYKISAAPFHYWTPDAFEAAPSSIAGIISVAPKIAGFGMLIALNAAFAPARIWMNILAAGAVLSMILGNLAALKQNNLQRLMAYSTIAHAGYILAAASLQSTYGAFAVLYYLAIYLFMNLGAFYVIGVATRQGALDEMRGLSSRAPFLSFSMAVILFSLTGLPPFGGFIGKLFIVSSALMAGKPVLVIVLVTTSVISLAYYARIVKTMYFEKSVDDAPREISPVTQTVIALIVAMIMVLGIAWESIGMAASRAAGLG